MKVLNLVSPTEIIALASRIQEDVERATFRPNRQEMREGGKILHKEFRNCVPRHILLRR